jgi:hypothetical protein
MERLLAVGIASCLFMKRNNADFVSLLKTNLKKPNLLSNYWFIHQQDLAAKLSEDCGDIINKWSKLSSILKLQNTTTDFYMGFLDPSMQILVHCIIQRPAGSVKKKLRINFLNINIKLWSFIMNMTIPKMKWITLTVGWKL